jgi:hypothetical protein
LKKLKPAPRAFRGELPAGYPEPGELQPVKIKSVLEEHWALGLVFGIVALALAAYFIKSILRAPVHQPPPPPSVYVEMVPQSEPQPPSAPSPPPQSAPTTPQ